MKNKRGKWLCLLCFGVVFGLHTACEDEDMDFDLETFDDETVEVASDSSAIRNGSEADASDPGANMVVRIYFITGKGVCTGQMLNKKWVVTAGHCLYEYLSKENTENRINVVYTKPNGKLKRVYLGEAKDWYIYPKFNGSLHPDDQVSYNDVGLILLGDNIAMSSCGLAGWCSYLTKTPGNAMLRYKGSWPSSWFMYGYGAIDDSNHGLGPLRSDPSIPKVKVEWGRGGRRLVGKWTSNGQARTCGGDSGAPWFHSVGAFHLSHGVASASDYCEQKTGSQWAAAWDKPKVHWVASMMLIYNSYVAYEFDCVTEKIGGQSYFHCDNKNLYGAWDVDWDDLQ